MKLIDIISEDVELDEVGPQKTKEQLIDDLKVKFPNDKFIPYLFPDHVNPKERAREKKINIS